MSREFGKLEVWGENFLPKELRYFKDKLEDKFLI